MTQKEERNALLLLSPKKSHDFFGTPFLHPTKSFLVGDPVFTPRQALRTYQWLRNLTAPALLPAALYALQIAHRELPRLFGELHCSRRVGAARRNEYAIFLR
jgi:hypothetical protein